MAQIGRKNKIRVHLTITTLDEALARLIEPRAPRPALRLNAVRKLTEAGVPVSVLAHPVMPLINDSEESLDRVCAAAARNGASSFSAAPLFLKPCSAQVFLPFLEERFPHLVRRYRERFEKAAYLKGHYPQMIAERVERIRARHGLATGRAPESPEPSQPQPFLNAQLDLFPQLAKGPSTAPTLQRKVNRL
jgi:DNA repair photolyase